MSTKEKHKKAASESANGSKPMPHNFEAERSILGAILLDASSLNDCIDVIGPDDFYQPAHAILFQSVIDLDNEGDDITEVNLGQRLEANAQLESVGGMPYVASLVDGAGAPANVRYYARIVRDHSLVRQFIDTHEALVAQAMSPGAKIPQLLDAVEEAQSLFRTDHNKSDFSPLDILIKDSLEYLDETQKNPELLAGVNTGLKGLDEMTTGLKGADLFILAARPSMGKTAFCLQVSRNVALREGKAVGIFSLEMSQRALVMRMLSAEAGVGAQAMRTRHLRKEDWRELWQAGQRLSKASMLIDDASGTNIAELRGKAKRMAQRQERLGEPPLGLIVVDYLQLLTLPDYSVSGRRSDNRQQEIAEISRSLKLLAVDLDVPILCLSQLNRSIENRPDATPRLADLRESGAIEQDADVVAFITKYKSGDDAPPPPGGGFRTPISLVIAKQRNGPTGTVNLVFDKEIQHFGEMGDEDGPDPDEVM